MKHRKQVADYPGLANWYDKHYTGMGDGWTTPAEDCARHLNDLGVPHDHSKLLLDIGCGAGHFLAEAAKRVDCVGIDISSVVLQYATKRCTGLPVRLACANIETLSGATKFDYIVSIGSLEHVLDLDQALLSIRNLLKPDGKFYFYLPNDKWIHEDQPTELVAGEVWWMQTLDDAGFQVEQTKRWGDSTAYWGGLSVVKVVEDRMRRYLSGEQIPELEGKRALTYGDIVPSQLRINLGSGQRPFGACEKCGQRHLKDTLQDHLFQGTAWVNVDLQEKWKPDVVADGSHMPMFKDNSADMIVLHHVLEHFGCGEADSMLKECYRILKPGGSLIVTVPNMLQLCTAWVLSQGVLKADRFSRSRPDISTQVFLTNVYGAYMGSDADRHRWAFNDISLHDTLAEAGAWSTIMLFDFRPIPGADIAKDWWILGTEAIK